MWVFMHRMFFEFDKHITTKYNVTIIFLTQKKCKQRLCRYDRYLNLRDHVHFAHQWDFDSCKICHTLNDIYGFIMMLVQFHRSKSLSLLSFYAEWLRPLMNWLELKMRLRFHSCSIEWTWFDFAWNFFIDSFIYLSSAIEMWLCISFFFSTFDAIGTGVLETMWNVV